MLRRMFPVLLEFSRHVPTDAHNKFLGMLGASLRGVSSAFPGYNCEGLQGTCNQVREGSPGRFTSDLESRTSLPGGNGSGFPAIPEGRGQRSFFLVDSWEKGGPGESPISGSSWRAQGIVGRLFLSFVIVFCFVFQICHTSCCQPRSAVKFYIHLLYSVVLYRTL